MTCGSCEILLERKLKAVPGILAVDIDHRRGTARIIADTNNLPSPELIEKIIKEAGYSCPIDRSQKGSKVRANQAPSAIETPQRKWLEIGAALLIIFALYKLLQTFNIVSLAPSTSGALSLGGILVIGLVAGASSCLAVTGEIGRAHV